MALAGKWPFSFGKAFYVVGSSFAWLSASQELFIPDADWVPRLFASSTAMTDALAQCVAGRGDVIYLDPSYTTALTATELLAVETKGVSIIPAGKVQADGNFFATRATATLPATATGNLFTVTGRVRLLAIVGEVTTAIQNQACNLKLTNTPTVGSAVDICANGSVQNLGVGTQLTITGTLATALQTGNGAILYPASSVILKAGTLDAITSATNTGSVKWRVIYQPIDPGALIIAA